MSWKTIKGNRYYYRSKREGDRVRSVYLGGGDRGLLFATLDEAERQLKLEKRSNPEYTAADDREFQDWFDRIERIASAALLVTGFHRHHRGPWRRKRHV